jgi:tetratricopeptide (TPR) repeat protein
MIARAWQRYLEAMTFEGPVVALIEDIHWADPSLLDLIEAVVSRASGAALVLCMARPDLFDRRPNWAGGMSSATTISLAPLSAGEGTALIEQLLGGDAPAEVVGPVLHRSEGNPFFAGELLRMMTEDGTLERRSGRWALVRELPSALPDTVQGVIASRIDLLPPAEKSAIQDASVIGRVFWQGAVERLGSADAAAAIDGLVDKGLVWERDRSGIEGERELIFNHILTRDVAYAGIPRARRADAHAAIGTWVEEHTSGRAAEFAEILAFHFDLAGDVAKTARYALLAGDRHRRVFAAEDAIRWYDRALDAAEAIGDDGLRGASALSRGEALEQLGRFEAAREDYERALVCARRAGDDRLEARALAATAHVLWLLDRYEEGRRVLPEALERARAAAAADLEARLLYTAGTMEFGAGEFRDALGLHRRALETAIRDGDQEGEALAHHGLCETLFFLGPFEEGLEHGLAADAILRRLGQRPMVHHNEYMLGWLHWVLGRCDEALAATQRAVAGCREVGNRRDEVMALNAEVEIRLAGADVAGAIELAGLAIRTATEIGVPRATMIATLCRADALAELWALDAFGADLDAAGRLSDEMGGRFQRPAILALRGLRSLVEGDRRAAVQRFDEARTDPVLLDRFWAARSEVLAWERVGDPDGLESVARSLEGGGSDAPVWGCWRPYAFALASDLRGDPGRAMDRAGEALEAATRGGERRVEWRAHRVLWRAARALGRGDEAAEHRRIALEIVRSIAEPLPEDLRRSFLSRPDVAELADAS